MHWLFVIVFILVVSCGKDAGLIQRLGHNLGDAAADIKCMFEKEGEESEHCKVEKEEVEK